MKRQNFLKFGLTWLNSAQLGSARIYIGYFRGVKYSNVNSKNFWPKDTTRVFQQPTYILMDDGKKTSMKIRVPQPKTK